MRPIMKQSYSDSHTKVIKPKGNWSLGLIKEIQNPESIVKKSGNIVVIKDKFPKAKFHYLILPNEDISSIFKLDLSHIGLLERFGDLYYELCQDHPDVKLRAGFHAAPSMQRLHMHIISNDMISPCLKTKVHWNSFTTSYFIPYEDLLKELKEKHKITNFQEKHIKDLLASPLKCNQCSFIPKNMPNLKEHLLTHS